MSITDELEKLFECELASCSLSLFDVMCCMGSRWNISYYFWKICRTTKTSCVGIVFDRSMKVRTNQQQFLANTHNWSRFISMLCEEFTIKQADNDADVLIIETAKEQFKRPNTTVVLGEDVDLLTNNW